MQDLSGGAEDSPPLSEAAVLEVLLDYFARGLRVVHEHRLPHALQQEREKLY